MPRETPDRISHCRGRSSNEREYWNKSRDYSYTEKKMNYRSRNDKIRHRSRSRSPKRTYRKRSSRSRSRSVSHSRRYYRGRSSSRSSSRSRSRSISRYSRRHRNRSQSKSSPSRGRSRSPSTPPHKYKEHSYDCSSSNRKNSHEKEEKELRVKCEPVDKHDYGEENTREEYQSFPGCSKVETEEDGPIDKEKIHKQIEEKLRQALAKEGKIYPPPKPEASHPVFANDGSFLEVFKKMQEQVKQAQQSDNSKNISKPLCKRRGGKILKTGIVSKPKVDNSNKETDPKDFWSIYLQEVKKYKSASCDIDSKTRPLVK